MSERDDKSSVTIPRIFYFLTMSAFSLLTNDDAASVTSPLRKATKELASAAAAVSTTEITQNACKVHVAS